MFSSPLICVTPSQAESRIKSTFESISVNLNNISVSLRQPWNISKMFATANNRVEGHCQWSGIRSAIKLFTPLLNVTGKDSFTWTADPISVNQFCLNGP